MVRPHLQPTCVISLVEPAYLVGRVRQGCVQPMPPPPAQKKNFVFDSPHMYDNETLGIKVIESLTEAVA
jgi:hypothetical protein